MVACGYRAGAGAVWVLLMLVLAKIENGAPPKRVPMSIGACSIPCNGPKQLEQQWISDLSVEVDLSEFYSFDPRRLLQNIEDFTVDCKLDPMPQWDLPSGFGLSGSRAQGAGIHFKGLRGTTRVL